MKIVLFGKPGTGKTTLFSRLTKRKIYPRPGKVERVTSDYQTNFFSRDDRDFSVTDTVGFLGASGVPADSEIVKTADVILVICDVNDFDSRDVRIITEVRRTGVPLGIVVNKVESRVTEEKIPDFYRFGLPVFGISALHKKGIDEMLEKLPEPSDSSTSGNAVAEFTLPDKLKKADVSCIVVGAPNVGKSTFLNAILKRERFRTSPEPGTTNEVVAEVLDTARGSVCFFDTAGIFRRFRKNELRIYNMRLLQDCMRRSDVVCFMIDAAGSISSKDLRIAALIKKKPCIMVFNKMDAVATREKGRLRSIPGLFFPYLPEPPEIFISALKKTGVNKVVREIFEIKKRNSARLQNIDRTVKAVFKKSRIILFVLLTRQVGFSPPEILIKYRRKKKLADSDKRYLSRLIRKKFPLRGIPLGIRWKKI